MRLGEQDFGQVEADLEAAGEFGGRLMELLVAEAEAGQDLFRFPDLIFFFFRQAEARFQKDRRFAEFEMLFEVADRVVLG